MDPAHHQKIADKLMQYRGKIPKTVNPLNKNAVCTTYELKKAIDDLLWYIENYAQAQDKGWV